MFVSTVFKKFMVIVISKNRLTEFISGSTVEKSVCGTNTVFDKIEIGGLWWGSCEGVSN